MPLSEEEIRLTKEYEKEVIEYTSIRNPVQKLKALNNILRKYSESLGFNRKDTENFAALFAQPDYLEADKKTTFTINELFKLPRENSKSIVPYLIPQGGGLIQVTAAPKQGKTMIAAYELIHGMCVSGSFLGVPCKRGRVLLLQTEESPGLILRRLESRGVEPWNELAKECFENNSLVIETDFQITDVARLKELNRQYNPDVIVFDSLRSISSSTGVDENSAKFSQPVYVLQKVLQREGVTGILIHHAKKGVKGNSVEDGSGSLSISGANDGMILLSPVSGSDGLICLKTIPREGIPIKWHIKRSVDPETGYWFFEKVADIGVDPLVAKIEKKVLFYIAQQVKKDPKARVSKKQIEDAVGVSDPDSLSALTSALDRLTEGDQIQQHKIKDSFAKCGFALVYGIDSTSPWVNFGDSVISGHPEHIEAEKLADCSTLDEINHLKDYWQREFGKTFQNKVFTCLSIPDQIKILGISRPFKYNVGDCVVIKSSGKQYIVEERKANLNTLTWDYKLESKVELVSQDKLDPVKVNFEEL